MTKRPANLTIIYRCACGVVRRRSFELIGSMYGRREGDSWVQPYQDEHCPCGRIAKKSVVNARISHKECGGVCTNAKGGSCDCKCGGANHGIAYA